MLRKISGKRQLDVIQVRTPEELSACDALIIPGGGWPSPSMHVPHTHASPESTTMGLLAKLSGLIEPLREFVKTKSVWGTCAGAILLSQAVSNPKKGGQELLGGVSVKMTRNGWGSQVRRLDRSAVSSPRALLRLDPLPIGRVFRSPAASEWSPEHPHTVPWSLHPRAGTITSFSSPSPSSGALCKVVVELISLASEPHIHIISRIPELLLPRNSPDDGPDRTVVALRQGRHLLTTFHPELTSDSRFHEYFVHECVLPSLVS